MRTELAQIALALLLSVSHARVAQRPAGPIMAEMNSSGEMLNLPLGYAGGQLGLLNVVVEGQLMRPVVHELADACLGEYLESKYDMPIAYESRLAQSITSTASRIDIDGDSSLETIHKSYRTFDVYGRLITKGVRFQSGEEKTWSYDYEGSDTVVQASMKQIGADGEARVSVCRIVYKDPLTARLASRSTLEIQELKYCIAARVEKEGLADVLYVAALPRVGKESVAQSCEINVVELLDHRAGVILGSESSCILRKTVRLHELQEHCTAYCADWCIGNGASRMFIRTIVNCSGRICRGGLLLRDKLTKFEFEWSVSGSMIAARLNQYMFTLLLAAGLPVWRAAEIGHQRVECISPMGLAVESAEGGEWMESYSVRISRYDNQDRVVVDVMEPGLGDFVLSREVVEWVQL